MERAKEIWGEADIIAFEATMKKAGDIEAGPHSSKHHNKTPFKRSVRNAKRKAQKAARRRAA